MINPVPTVTSVIPDQTANDGDFISLDISGHFNDESTLTFTASQLPTGLSISSDGVISGTIAANASATGTFNVTVTATDIDGAEVDDSFTLQFRILLQQWQQVLLISRAMMANRLVLMSAPISLMMIA